MVIETQVEVRGISPCLFSETKLPLFAHFSGKMTNPDNFNQKFNSGSYSSLVISVHCSSCFFLKASTGHCVLEKDNLITSTAVIDSTEPSTTPTPSPTLSEGKEPSDTTCVP